MMLDIDIGSEAKRPADPIYIMTLILGLTLIGWSLMALSVFDMMLRGVAGSAGPGMHVFAGISPAALSDKFNLPYRFSLCVTNTGIWSAADFAKSFLMWGAMVLAMMLPTRLTSSAQARKPLGFTLSYLAVWFISCAFAVILQWQLDSSGLLDAHMVSQSAYFSGVILIAVGAFQLSPFKQKHLAACRGGAGRYGTHNYIRMASWPALYTLLRAAHVGDVCLWIDERRCHGDFDSVHPCRKVFRCV